MNKTAQKRRGPSQASAARKRYFFFLLSEAGYRLPEDKAQAWADLRIESLKTISAAELEKVIFALKNTIRKKDDNFRSLEEKYASWRESFFPANVLSFGLAKREAISEKQQNYLIVNAAKVFRTRSNFQAWLKNYCGCSVISDRSLANAVCRGIAEMAARAGHDPAPPAKSLRRADWEARHKKEGEKNEIE